MVTGYRSGGIDFDDLFDPYVQGDRSPLSGRRVSGVDLNQRFAPILYGTKRADVGYRTGGVDLSNFWAAKGTASYGLPFNGQSYTADSEAPTNAQGNASAGIQLVLLTNGNYTINRTGNFTSSPAQLSSGRWLPNGQTVGQYEVMMTAENVGAASINSNANSFSGFNVDRAISATLAVPAASSQLGSANPVFNVDMRRAGIVTRSVLYVNLFASGWQ